MVAIVHRIYEGTSHLPVLEHRFFGKTVAEAERIYFAHMKTDSFLRRCVEKGKFADFTCRFTTHLENVPNEELWG